MNWCLGIKVKLNLRATGLFLADFASIDTISLRVLAEIGSQKFSTLELIFSTIRVVTICCSNDYWDRNDR
jgi:hypothetical protein